MIARYNVIIAIARIWENPKVASNKKTLERMHRAAQKPSHSSSFTSLDQQGQEALAASRKASIDVEWNFTAAFIESSTMAHASGTDAMDLDQEGVDMLGQFDLADMEYPLFDSSPLTITNLWI